MIQIYSYLHHEINRFDVRLVFVYFRATIYIFASYNNFNNMRHLFLLYYDDVGFRALVYGQ